MSNIPTQLRTIDSYESYNSNVSNRLTRIVTHTTDVIMRPDDLNITWDGESPSIVTLKKGSVIKDDVLIEISDDFIVDLSQAEFYLNPRDTYWNEVGTYYIALNYMYLRAKPAPTASIVIFKHSQLGFYNNQQYMFLKCVDVVFSNNQFLISALYDYDPANTSICRRYPTVFMGRYNSLPTWDDSYVSRMIFNEPDGLLYMGTPSGWIPYDDCLDYMDTTGYEVGQLIYKDSSDNGVSAAIGGNRNTMASGVVTTLGLKVDKTGIVKLFGKTRVLIETGATFVPGDTVYLSNTQAGTVTNLEPNDSTSSYQIVGRAIANNTLTYVDIWFCPDMEYSKYWGTNTYDSTNITTVEVNDELEVYPEILTSNNTLATTVAGNTVQVNVGQEFIMRDSHLYNTSTTTFTSSALSDGTYHLRFVYTTDDNRYNFGSAFYTAISVTSENFYIADLNDHTNYNPSSKAENDPDFDSKYDDMLVAKIVVTSNVPVVTLFSNTNAKVNWIVRRWKQTYQNLDQEGVPSGKTQPKWMTNAQYISSWFTNPLGGSLILKTNELNITNLGENMMFANNKAVSFKALVTGNWQVDLFGVQTGSAYIRYYKGSVTGDVELIAEGWYRNTPTKPNNWGSTIPVTAKTTLLRGDSINPRMQATYANTTNGFFSLDNGFDAVSNWQTRGSCLIVTEIS